MINVRAFAIEVEDLVDPNYLPSVDAQRPAFCASCGNPAHPPGGCLGIVGHGTYQRQVRGFAPGEWILVHIRRFLCVACKRTTSVLPDSLLPWRWYSGTAILRVLVQVLLLGVAVADLRGSIGPGGRDPHWSSPARWMRQLGERLWSWHAAELGHSPGLEHGDFLGRLLGLAGAHARSPDDELEVAARRLVTGTTHAPGDVRREGHAR